MVTHCQKETLSSGEERVDAGIAFGEATVLEGCTGDTGRVPDTQRADDDMASKPIASSGSTG